MGILTTNLSCFGGKVAGHPCVFFCIKTIKVSWWAWACPEMGDSPKWFWGGTWYTNHCSVLGLLAYVQTNLRCVFSYYWYLWWFQCENILHLSRVRYFQDNPSSSMTRYNSLQVLYKSIYACNGHPLVMRWCIIHVPINHRDSHCQPYQRAPFVIQSRHEKTVEKPSIDVDDCPMSDP